MEGLQTIEMVIEDEATNGVSALSLVEKPANEDETVLLSQDNQAIQLSEVMESNEVIELAQVDEEQQLIMGLILEPNKPIYRRNGEKEYNIIFSENTVKKAAHLYMKNLNNNNATLDHKEKVDGVSLVETWLVRDPKRDASNVFGKEYKKGAWACVLKVHNKDQWEEYKENGTTNISLEGVFKPKKQEQKSELESKLSMLKSIAKDLK